MGCDIHLQVERQRPDGSWARVHPIDVNPKALGQCGPTDDVEVYSDRCYPLFAILADIRNSYGLIPLLIAKGESEATRGLPLDTTLSTRYDDLGDHSFSWLTLEELEYYPWLAPQDRQEGSAWTVMIPAEMVHKFYKETIPLLRALAAKEQVTYSKIRIVFGFDS